VKQLAVGPSTNLIDYGRLQVDKDGSRHVFASASLAEEGVERVVTPTDRLVTRHLTVGLDAVFQAVQLPTGIAHLHSGLADMYGNTLTHFGRFSLISSSNSISLVSQFSH